MKPRILITYANDNRSKLKLSEEAKDVQNVFENNNTAVDLKLLPAVTLSDITAQFDRYENQIEIFHYAGHADDFNLLIKTDQGDEARIDGQSFAKYLANRSKLKLVFLNGCSTQMQAETLTDFGVPYVIATSQKINDSIARKFAEEFYQSFSNGHTVDKAFADAKLKTDNWEKSGQIKSGFSRDLKKSRNQSVIDEPLWKLYKHANAPLNWKLEKGHNRKTFKLPPNFFLKCDREPHIKKFKALNEIKIPKTPNVCIVPGPESGMHDSFMKRIELHLEKNKQNKVFRSYEIEKWNSESLELREMIIDNTFSAFGLQNRDDIDLDNAQAILDNMPSNSIYLIYKKIELETEEVLEELKWYINDFWKVDIKDAARENKKVFVFLNIIPPKKKGLFGFFKRSPIQKFVNTILEMAKEKPKPTMACFPFLGAIKKSDIKDFLIQEKISLPNWEAQFSDDESWDMFEVECRLRKFLK